MSTESPVAPSSAIRESNLHAVLGALERERPASRADLALRTGLSKPTVGSALRTLLDAGLVREYGRITGRRGPSASLYDTVPGARLVLGLDIGAHYLRGVVADLDGDPVEELTIELAHPEVRDLLAAIADVRRRIAPLRDHIELAVVGSPGIIDPASGRIHAAPNVQGWEGILAETLLRDALELPVQVENDINLAALGEQAEGGGRGIDSFALLAIGTGVGVGLILHGQLHRGARGAAGEIGYLPVGADPFSQTLTQHSGAMEASLSGRGLAEYAERLATTLPSTLSTPFDARTLFDAARSGDPLGRAVTAHAARGIALCVASLTAIVDLDLVLVGGSIGVNHDLLFPDVQRAAARLLPFPPSIQSAQLGDRATQRGAVAVALKQARRAIIRRLVSQEPKPDVL